MAQLFYSCKSLISLDLTSFIASNVKAFAVMFKEFINLQYINFKLFDTSSKQISDGIFYETSEKLIVCAENENNFIFDFLNKKKS